MINTYNSPNNAIYKAHYSPAYADNAAINRGNYSGTYNLLTTTNTLLQTLPLITQLLQQLQGGLSNQLVNAGLGNNPGMNGLAGNSNLGGTIGSGNAGLGLGNGLGMGTGLAGANGLAGAGGLNGLGIGTAAPGLGGTPALLNNSNLGAVLGTGFGGTNGLGNINGLGMGIGAPGFGVTPGLNGLGGMNGLGMGAGAPGFGVTPGLNGLGIANGIGGATGLNASQGLSAAGLGGGVTQMAGAETVRTLLSIVLPIIVQLLQQLQGGLNNAQGQPGNQNFAGAQGAGGLLPGLGGQGLNGGAMGANNLLPGLGGNVGLGVGQGFPVAQNLGGMQNFGINQGFGGMQNFGINQGFGGVQNFGINQGFGGVQNFSINQGFGGVQNFGINQDFGGVQNVDINRNINQNNFNINRNVNRNINNVNTNFNTGFNRFFDNLNNNVNGVQGNQGLNRAPVNNGVQGNQGMNRAPNQGGQINAQIVGENNIMEGGKGTYKIQLDRPVAQDTVFTIRAQDGTAKQTNEADASRQDIVWGGKYTVAGKTIEDRVPNGNSPSDGNREQVGGDGTTDWDYTLSKNGQTGGNGDIQVLVRAGQTMSDSFMVNAWQEKVTIDRDQGGNENHKEDTENFNLMIAGANGNNVDNINANNQMQVNIQDKTDYKYVSPVALDLNGDGKISTTGASTARDRIPGTELGNTVQFDIDADGQLDEIEWMSGNGDGLLVDTSRIGPNNEIDGSALFGDLGGKFANGYDNMARYDANGDGQLSGAEMNNVAIWMDDGDAKLEAGELRTLGEFGINQLSTQKRDVQNERGETLMQSDALANGRSILTEDVWFGKK